MHHHHQHPHFMIEHPGVIVETDGDRFDHQGRHPSNFHLRFSLIVIVVKIVIFIIFCLVYDDVGRPELVQIVRLNDGKADKILLNLSSSFVFLEKNLSYLVSLT